MKINNNNGKQIFKGTAATNDKTGTQGKKLILSMVILQIDNKMLYSL
jgi:hypothetical protein